MALLIRAGAVQVRYCLHVQQRLLKEQWPIQLAEHHMARTVSMGDLEGGGPGGQVLFNGLRVRMAINTGMLVSPFKPSGFKCRLACVSLELGEACVSMRFKLDW